MGERQDSGDTSTPWTVGQLRAALDGLPADTPLRIQVVDADGFADEQVVESAGFGTVMWNGHEERDRVLDIICELVPEGWAWSQSRYGTYRRPPSD